MASRLSFRGSVIPAVLGAHFTPLPPVGGKLPHAGGGGPGSGRRREAVTTYSLEDLLAPEDTVSNLDRATMKGPAKSGGAKPNRPAATSARQSPSPRPGCAPGSGKQREQGDRKAAAANSPPDKDPLLLNKLESVVAEELALFTPRSETTYDPTKPRKLRGSGPKIPWERYGVLAGVAAIVILFIVLVVYVRSQPKLSDSLIDPATGHIRQHGSSPRSAAKSLCGSGRILTAQRSHLARRGAAPTFGALAVSPTRAVAGEGGRREMPGEIGIFASCSRPIRQAPAESHFDRRGDFLSCYSISTYVTCLKSSSPPT